MGEFLKNRLGGECNYPVSGMSGGILMGATGQVDIFGGFVTH